MTTENEGSHCLHEIKTGSFPPKKFKNYKYGLT